METWWEPRATTRTSTQSGVGSNVDSPSLPVLPRPLLSRWNELPVVSRYVGHLVIFLLLFLSVWGIVPASLDVPDFAFGPDGAAPVWVSNTVGDATEGVLAGAILPSTARSLRGVVLPLGGARPEVRTSVIVYEVQPGDTVLGIAQKFGLEGNSLLWANGRLADNPDFLSIGQKLNILPVDGALHKVQSGETVEAIAKKYDVSVEAIARYEGNHLSEPYALTVGQELIVPGGVKPYVPRVIEYNASVKAPSNMQRATGAFGWPMAGWISQGYWEGHRAIDIAAGRGTSIVAADNGYVVTAQWSDVGYGRMVIVDHGNGFRTLYAHMDAYYVSVGQAVVKGQSLGICGSTGNSTGPHLHFEIILNGVRRNPFIYLP